jgi:hypothetical protein
MARETELQQHHDKLAAQLAVDAEKLRLDLMLLNQINSDLRAGEERFPQQYEYPPLRGIEVSWKDGTLKFRIPECPSTVRKIGRIERERWIMGMVEAYQRTGLNLRFACVHVRIAIFLPAEYQWDPDNRALKPIMDALPYLKLVQDDRWNFVRSYTVIPGIDRERPRTVVLVSEATGEESGDEAYS